MISAEENLHQAVWIARTLFQLGRTSGSTGNISFQTEEGIYISRSGACFGTLSREDFSLIDMDGRVLEGKDPSKEYPLHLMYYKRFSDIHGVIHTHGRYGILWSCIPDLDANDCVPPHTPYLEMKLGKIRLVPYEKPGTQELFRNLERCMGDGAGYLLKRHGALVGGRTLMDAFYGIEELEESAFIAWNLYRSGIGGGK
ncbi:MAG TPA: class II aldolase/adducin family protein [Candidatus Egerieimonas faecigallinarum]|nr:class II aldolase/adducin family protein [Candidatus Egerieimonas faecigallinarum]